MSSWIQAIASLVVANGATASNVLRAGRDFRDADSLTLFGPNGLAEVATVQVSYEDSDNPTAWFALSRGGADVTVAANKAITVELPSFLAVRILLGGAAGAERTFRVNKAFMIH